MDNIYQIKMDQWLLPIFKPIIEKSYRFFVLVQLRVIALAHMFAICYLLTSNFHTD